MLVSAKITWVPLSIILILLSFSACRQKEETPNPNSLPDLAEQARPYVTTENTMVRTGPGIQFRTIAEIRRNSKVHVVGRDGEWLLIVSKKGNAPGFIEMASAKPGDAEASESSGPPVEGKYETLVNTRVRSGPGIHYPVVAEIPKGTKITVVDEEKGWLRVESKRGNKPGYVEGSLARPVEG